MPPGPGAASHFRATSAAWWRPMDPPGAPWEGTPRDRDGGVTREPHPCSSHHPRLWRRSSPGTAVLPAASATPAPWRRCPGARRGSAVPTHLLNLDQGIKKTSKPQPQPEAKARSRAHGTPVHRALVARQARVPHLSPPASPQAAISALAVFPFCPGLERKRPKERFPQRPWVQGRALSLPGP